LIPQDELEEATRLQEQNCLLNNIVYKYSLDEATVSLCTKSSVQREGTRSGTTAATSVSTFTALGLLFGVISKLEMNR
jgi:hypothetical protein